MKSTLALVAALLVASCAANAKTLKHDTGNGIVTFETDTSKPNTLTLFSTSEKPFACEIVINFTWEDKEGKRQPGVRTCFLVPYPAGKKVNICEAQHENLVEMQIDEIKVTQCSK